MGGSHFLGYVEQRARVVVVGNDQLASRMQCRERRLLLDGELIEREVFGGLVNRARQFGAPGVGGLAGPRIDQIERIAIEGLARDRDRIERFLRAVQSAKLFQRRVVERLHAERGTGELPIGASFGVAVADSSGPVDSEALLRRADDAMYDAKGSRAVLRVAA